MNTDDIIYLVFLLFSIAFGGHYRKIQNVESKKRIGAIVGFIIVVMVSKLHFLHVVITVLINSFIILYSDKRSCHIKSFAFSFVYLIFFRTTAYFGLPYPPSHTNLIQMILTLKIVGLAFEVNSAYNSQKIKDDSKVAMEDVAEGSMCDFSKLQMSDIFYYSLNYIGVLTGPYYKYCTYNDHLTKPFNKYDDYKNAVKNKLFPWVPVFALIYLFTDYMWPVLYTQSPEFDQRSFLYHYWYMWPTFITFRMRIYIALTLSECVCVMGGLGVYPAFANSQSGHGPSANFVKLNELCNSDDGLKGVEYDYETVHGINAYKADFSPTIREGMKNWNMTVQYWLASCVYKRFPSKTFRTAATMLVSGLWHGVYTGYCIAFGLVPLGLIVEDIWVKLLLKDDFFLPKKLGYLIMLFMKMQFFSYASLAFLLLDMHKLFHYYNLVFHWMMFFIVFMFFAGQYLLKMKMRLQSHENANGH